MVRSRTLVSSRAFLRHNESRVTTLPDRCESVCFLLIRVADDVVTGTEVNGEGVVTHEKDLRGSRTNTITAQILAGESVRLVMSM
jgi:hypothetical protein